MPSRRNETRFYYRGSNALGARFNYNTTLVQAGSIASDASSATGEAARSWRPRWLMATALPCADRQAVNEVRTFISLHASARMHVRANIFDAALPEAQLAACAAELTAGVPSMVSLSYVRGHKTLFWRHELTPAAVARYDLIWLLDCDVRVSPHLLSLREVEYWISATAASIVQPTVVPARVGGRAGRASFTRTALSADCMAREVPFIEQMTPIFRRGAFERLVCRNLNATHTR